MRIYSKLFLVLICISAIQCQREMSEQPQPGILPQKNITASVSGRITNDIKEPVKGAVVSIGNTSVVTDLNGFFNFNNTLMKEDAALIVVEKTGYFKSYRIFRARTGNRHYVEVQLLPNTISGEFSAAAGGTISLPNGNSVTFPVSSFVVKQTGSVYSGNVKVAMRSIDPVSADFFRQLPGDLRGIDINNKEKTLSSFGILGVELYSSGGEVLQLAQGKKASLHFSISSSLQSTAPSTIDLWYFDEALGMWKQEGNGIKTGNAYNAEVNHFSFWAVNAPSNTVQFTATFKDQNGLPLAYHLVRTKYATDPSVQSYGFTDSAGFIRGNIVENRPMFLEVMMNSSCTTAIHSQSLGPLPAGSIILGTIQVTVPSMFSYTLSGNAINCSGQAVQDGYVEVTTGIQILRSPVNNGNFSVSFNHCSGNQPVKYIVVDNGAGQQTSQTTVTLNSGNNNIGTVMACGMSTQQFISILVDGTTYMLVAPTDSIKASCYPAYAAVPSVDGISIHAMNNGRTSEIDLQLKNPNAQIYNGPNYAIYPTPLIKLAGRTDTLERMPGRSVPLTITEFGVSGEYISGAINDTLWSNGLTTPHPYQLNFRVKRKD